MQLGDRFNNLLRIKRMKFYFKFVYI